jgi:hypothetical protein
MSMATEQVGILLRQIAEGYLRDAHREDEGDAFEEFE